MTGGIKRTDEEEGPNNLATDLAVSDSGSVLNAVNTWEKRRHWQGAVNGKARRDEVKRLDAPGWRLRNEASMKEAQVFHLFECVSATDALTREKGGGLTRPSR